jgi:hypothetical protein
MAVSRSVEDVRASIDAAAASHADKIDRMARLGYAANGVVYLVIGWLAVKAAIGAGGGTTGARGALRQILRESYGSVLLAVLALGLAGYALWRFVQCFNDPDREGRDVKGLAVRAGYFVSGVVRVALTVAAVSMLAGRGGGGEEGARAQTALLMSAPAGRLLVALVGVGILVTAGAQLWRAYKKKFMRHLALSGKGARARAWVRRAGAMGHSALGVVFFVVALFLLVAAQRADPGEAKGLGEALQTLGQQPYGPYLLGGVGAGLFAYGLFQFVEARYRRIAPF